MTEYIVQQIFIIAEKPEDFASPAKNKKDGLILLDANKRRFPRYKFRLIKRTITEKIIKRE